jgi:hypothetical protein
MHTKIWSEIVKGRDHSKNLSVDRNMILERISGKQGVDWMHLAQDRDQWQALVNKVMNLHVPIFLVLSQMHPNFDAICNIS